MRERILKTTDGNFELLPDPGANRSGIQPVGDMLLVMVDPVKTRTGGGIILTDDIADRQTMSSTTGIVLAMGDSAFLFDGERVANWHGSKPKVGDRVFFQKYAGQTYTGTDGRVYRVLQDRSVAGIGIDHAKAVSASTIAA